MTGIENLAKRVTCKLMNEGRILEFQQFVNDGQITIDVPLGILDAHGGGTSNTMIDKRLLKTVDVVTA